MAKLLGTKSVTEKEERGSQKRGGREDVIIYTGSLVYTGGMLLSRAVFIRTA